MDGIVRIAQSGIVVVAGLALACGGGGNTASYELAPAPVLERTSGGCGPALLPQVIPSVSALVDSTELIGRLRERAASSRETTVSIVFPGSNVPAHASVLQTGWSADAAEAIRRSVDSLLIAPDSAVSPWAIRLRLGSGERSTIGVSRAEYCPPVAAAADVRSESYVGPVSAADLARAEADARRLQQQWRQMQEYVGRAWVSSDGQVTVVEAVERSGNRVADREAETMLRRNRF